MSALRTTANLDRTGGAWGGTGARIRKPEGVLQIRGNLQARGIRKPEGICKSEGVISSNVIP